MIRYENECRQCSSEGYPCIGTDCSYLKTPHYYCDQCGYEETLYHYNDKQMCITCIEKSLDKVEG